MSELITILLAALLLAMATRSATRLERVAAFACLGVHVVLAWFQVWLHARYYGVSDMHTYFEEGKAIARFLDFDFLRFAPEVAKLALHQETSLPAFVNGEGAGTGTMAAFDGFITYVFGESPVTACIVVGAFATMGQILMYRAARPMLAQAAVPLALVGFLFVPSVVFWSSAFSKEAFVLGFFGILCYSAQRFSSGKKLALVGVVIGAVGIAIVKSYVLFPFVVAIAGWYFANRNRAGAIHVSILQFVFAALFVVVGIIVMGNLFPEFALDKLGEQAALQRGYGASAGGGSFTEIGDDQARTMSQQLPFVPLALFTCLFRPLPFEVKNAPMAGAALETTALIVGTIALLVRFRLRPVVRAVLDSPLLAFSAVFVATFSVAVGLTTTNLGTLSRYRMPMMPFYVTFILLLSQQLTRRRGAVPQPIPVGTS